VSTSRPCLTPRAAINRVGELPDFRRLAFHDDHFQAVVVVQMNVQRGEDLVVILVLQLGELFAEQPDVMVVEQRHGTGYQSRGLDSRLLNQFRPDEIAKRFRAIGVAAAGNERVELLQQAMVDGHANPFQLSVLAFRSILHRIRPQPVSDAAFVTVQQDLQARCEAVAVSLAQFREPL